MTPRELIARLVNGDARRRGNSCYSHNGEDLVLGHLFGDRRTGFFVDVGAHHPMHYSNTYLLYKRGWRGINIDAEPGSMRAFNRWRPRDINVGAAVGTQEDALTYYRFNAPALNTFDSAEAELKNVGQHHIIERVPIPMRRLEAILEQHLPPDQSIDFMTIDVEGWEIDVLRSNDWERFRPRYILAEILRTPIPELFDHQVTAFLKAVGYVPTTQSFYTTFFEDERQASHSAL